MLKEKVEMVIREMLEILERETLVELGLAVVEEEEVELPVRHWARQLAVTVHLRPVVAVVVPVVVVVLLVRILQALEVPVLQEMLDQ
jgi:hypothetical protein